jgi:hypothetical protein
MSGVNTTGLELGSCKGSCREVSVDDGAPSDEDPLQVKIFLDYAEYIARRHVAVTVRINA